MGEAVSQDGAQGTRPGFPRLNPSTSQASCWTLYIHDLLYWDPHAALQGGQVPEQTRTPGIREVTPLAGPLRSGACVLSDATSTAVRACAAQ